MIFSGSTDFCPPLIRGIIQKVHLLLHHSAILMYSYQYSALVYALADVGAESGNLNSVELNQLMSFCKLIFSKSDREMKKIFESFVILSNPPDSPFIKGDNVLSLKYWSPHHNKYIFFLAFWSFFIVANISSLPALINPQVFRKT
jgi:hypothetical protein